MFEDRENTGGEEERKMEAIDYSYGDWLVDQ